ncbi:MULTISPECIES: hypothetical protein [unclassified Streptomyces]|uniref:hypothetical protein n=1 Tax=unclassified Streptomyces TaxID=2593676 RepID=UPI0033DE190D
MGRILLGNAVVAFIAAAVGALVIELWDHWTFWDAARAGVWTFVGLTMVGTAREWQRSRRSRR